MENSRGKKSSESEFEALCEELKVEIFRRLTIKTLARLRCVSRSWGRILDSSCLSILTCSGPNELPFSGFIHKIEDPNSKASDQASILVFTGYRLSCKQGGRFSKPKKLHQSRYFNLLFAVEPHELLDSCNGLLLIRDNNPSGGEYVVVNPTLKQYVVVDPPGPTCFEYVALAYDPSASLYFKIVAFHGSDCLRVFSSETAEWSSDLVFDLQEDIAEAEWLQQSVYLQGAIYRLSTSGHVLQFQTKVVGCGAHTRARAIRVPDGIRIDPNHLQVHIGLSNGHLNFGVCDKWGLKTWVLERTTNRDIEFCYEWIPKHSVPGSHILPNRYELRTLFRPLAFHPYSDVILIGYFNEAQGLRPWEPDFVEKPFNFWFTWCHPNDCNNDFYRRCRLYDLQVRCPQARASLFPVFHCRIPFVPSAST